MKDLREAVEAQFKGFEVPTYAGLRVFTKVGKDEAMSVEERKRYKQEHEKARLAKNPDARRAKAAKQREKRLRKNLAAWMQDAKVICIGRETDPEYWFTVMTAEQEYELVPEAAEARIDFMYFLHHCKKVPYKNIGSMLDMDPALVAKLLSRRK